MPPSGAYNNGQRLPEQVRVVFPPKTHDGAGAALCNPVLPVPCTFQLHEIFCSEMICDSSTVLKCQRAHAYHGAIVLLFSVSKDGPGGCGKCKKVLPSVVERVHRDDQKEVMPPPAEQSYPAGASLCLDSAAMSNFCRFSHTPLLLADRRHDRLHHPACHSTEIYERQMHLAKYEDMLADHCKKALSGLAHNPCSQVLAPRSPARPRAPHGVTVAAG